MHPIRIAPSLLASDFANLQSEIAEVEAGGADWLHIDVMDGHFVPNITMGPPVVASIKKVAKAPLDVHLMITDPWKYAVPFLEAGADVLTFHLEVAGRGDVHELIKQIQGAGAKAAMAINPDADVHALEPYLRALDMVLVMSVFPGFGGQSFMDEVLESVSTLRTEMGFTGEIEMDGGIDQSTIESCAAAGTNVFVAGTAVFRAPDVAQRIADLRDLAASARPALQ
jgi:ribulose-phosphate 3-epimerase